MVRDFLKGIATDSDRVPTLYYSNFTSVRKFFWMRLRLIRRLIFRYSPTAVTSLDFGGGGGVFLPTLSQTFKQVVCVDLENAEAVQVIRKYALQNVELVTGDIAELAVDKAPFDVIVAADVLEHFRDLSMPVPVIRQWLAQDGVLYTSLPTENFLYIFLRWVFGVEKPWDHYHTAQEVEDYLADHGFRKISSLYVPLYINFFPLFRISAWKIC